MKTQREFVTEVIAAKVASGIQNDIIKKKGFGDRIKKAGEIVLADGVKPISYNDFDVASGTEAERTYHVNGECECQDAQNWAKKQKGEVVKSFAPSGYCKHRLAVEMWKHARKAMKELTDKGGTPHIYHRWTCTAHRDQPIVCWDLPCPDPIDVACPTCTAVNPHVPPHIKQIIAEEGVPTQTYIVHPDDDIIDPETGEILEEPPMMTTIGETIIGVVSSLNGHSNGTSATEPPAPILMTEQYEPAPVLTPRPQTLPEAGASLNIKLRMDQAEIMYTMRGHQDSEVLERLPEVLATLERILKIEVDHEEPFLKRLLHAFFPKPSRYTGK